MARSFLMLTVFCTAVFFSQFANAQLSGDTYASAKAKGSATWIYTYSEAPGFAESGEQGITYDIMNAFEKWVEDNKGMSVTVKHQTTDPNNFTKFLDVVKSSKGGVFGLSNTTITEARKRDYNFSPPYITNIGMILTKDTAPTMKSLNSIAQDFSGMTAVTVKNSTNEKRLLDIKAKHYPGMKLQYVASFQEAMKMVLADETKFANVDFTYYLDAVQTRQPVKRHAAGDDPTEQFGIIMPLSNDWAPLLAEFMSSYIDSTEYKKALMNNLGAGAIKFFDTLK